MAKKSWSKIFKYSSLLSRTFATCNITVEVNLCRKTCSSCFYNKVKETHILKVNVNYSRNALVQGNWALLTNTIKDKIALVCIHSTFCCGFGRTMFFIPRRGFIVLMAILFTGVQHSRSQVIINEFSFHGENLFIELKSEESKQPLNNYYLAICDFAPLTAQGHQKATLNVRALIDLKGKTFFFDRRSSGTVAFNLYTSFFQNGKIMGKFFK